jgi:SET domain-containing protein
LEKQQYCVYNVFHEWFTLYPFYNENLKRLDQVDEQIIDRYARKELAFPVIVKVINKVKGKGLVARRPIKKGELVATYSGNVMALSQVAKYGDKVTNQYTFNLVYGPDVMSNYAVYPKDYASVGFFMNHAKTKNNVSTEVVLTNRGPLILMIASKEIQYGKELVYNYNACLNLYNTDDF